MPEQPILALNSGSSSLKFGLFAPADDGEKMLLSGSAEAFANARGTLQIRGADGALLHSREVDSQAEAVQVLAAMIEQQFSVTPMAVGHRIVHGGPHLRTHCLLTPQVLEQLESAVHFAPLHIPLALALLRQAQRTFASSLHFICLDTAFHRSMPEVASHLPLPQPYFEQGVLRYGFHGLSFESVVRRLGPEIPRRVVVAHLGNGVSLCAIENGRSIDTSMSLTPTGGVPMSTRTGDLDPGVLLYLLRTQELGTDSLEKLVNFQSGLAGLSGGESDMQQLLLHADAGDRAAALAIDAFCTAVRKQIGAYAALLGGLDLLIFTGGIGEHSAAIRTRICSGLEFMGVDAQRVRVMRAEEELQIALHCRALLFAAAQS